MQTNCPDARTLRIVLGVGLLLLAAGCNSRSAVSGKVLYKDKPLPGGGVIFIHEKGAFSSAIQDDGSYHIANVPAGQVKIVVTGPRAMSGPNPAMKQSEFEKQKNNVSEVKEEEAGPKDMMAEMTKSPAAQGKKPVILIPPKYGNPEQSGLTYTVGSSSSQTYDIKLE